MAAERSRGEWAPSRRLSSRRLALADPTAAAPLGMASFSVHYERRRSACLLGYVISSWGFGRSNGQPSWIEIYAVLIQPWRERCGCAWSVEDNPEDTPSERKGGRLGHSKTSN
mmetsp:Transcript_48340/g.102805  ORF Transcript_48340/g.102805 Transcript_48340/m.102805 type:complete len:113 (-) Transcript_48340:34-372(-)